MHVQKQHLGTPSRASVICWPINNSSNCARSAAFLPHCCSNLKLFCGNRLPSAQQFGHAAGGSGMRRGQMPQRFAAAEEPIAPVGTVAGDGVIGVRAHRILHSALSKSPPTRGLFSFYICPYSMTTLQCQRVSLESRFRICAQIVDKLRSAHVVVDCAPALALHKRGRTTHTFEQSGTPIASGEAGKGKTT